MAGGTRIFGATIATVIAIVSTRVAAATLIVPKKILTETTMEVTGKTFSLIALISVTSDQLN